MFEPDKLKRISNDLYTLNKCFKVKVLINVNEPTGTYKRKMVDINSSNGNYYATVNTQHSHGIMFTKITPYYTPGILPKSMFISSKNYYKLADALLVCYEWMVSDKFNNLFDTDPNGYVKGIGVIPDMIPSIVLNKYNERIEFVPAIVEDYNGVKYEGIGIRCGTEDFALMTCEEYLNMYHAISDFLTNPYMATLQLTNLSFNYALMGMIIEMNKNKN